MIAGVAAYGLWGLLPLFFRLLHHVDPTEIVTQRVIWSLLLIVAILAARNALRPFFIVLLDRKLVLRLALSAALIAINWLTYVWAVNKDHVVAASLGYFLNPMVNVTLGVIVLKEKLRHRQVAAIAVAAVGVAILAASALTTLWISLTLAFSFAFYGLVRKLTPVAPMTGLGVETALLTPPAIAYLFWEAAHGGIGFGQDVATSSLLVLAGAVTTVPLVLFAVAAQRLPMSTLGLLQYLAPTLQFLCGVLLLGETLGTGQMVSFGLIWLGLIFFAGDGIAVARRKRMARA
ncbi:MAG: EamA family transporter RarD [Sphingobium sp.]|uniref:EamA family transporter RarD n=1 Tax=Sphingobium sp. TaxID=1912891 RepID=UPI000DB86C17|nr:EamA family transporter RarD [Sphingobium sp.]PZU08082.1 MAG: EamA family transporter RarD [Sphingobium sp.]